MWAALVRGDALSPQLRAEMVRPQLPILSAGQFPTLVSRPGPQVPGLAAGLGVVTFQDRSGAGWFKGGHNDSTGNMAICLEAPALPGDAVQRRARRAHLPRDRAPGAGRDRHAVALGIRLVRRVPALRRRQAGIRARLKSRDWYDGRKSLN